jgi:hypothetical protein
MIILKGKNHQASWYEIAGIPSGSVIAVSENGWTNNQLGLFWLNEVINRLWNLIDAWKTVVLEKVLSVGKGSG